MRHSTSSNIYIWMCVKPFITKWCTLYVRYEHYLDFRTVQAFSMHSCLSHGLQHASCGRKIVSEAMQKNSKKKKKTKYFHCWAENIVHKFNSIMMYQQWYRDFVVLTLDNDVTLNVTEHVMVLHVRLCLSSDSTRANSANQSTLVKWCWNEKNQYFHMKRGWNFIRSIMFVSQFVSAFVLALSLSLFLSFVSPKGC